MFCCLCYATKLIPKHKFDPQTRQCVFPGYPEGQKGYKILDLESHWIFSSRDVIFHETTFHFSHQQTKIKDNQIVLSTTQIQNLTYLLLTIT